MLLNLNAKTVSIILDVIVVAVLFIFGLSSAKKGFVAVVFGLLSTIVAGVVAFLLVKSVLTWTKGFFGLQNKLTEWCISGFGKIKGFAIDISNDGLRTSLTAKNLPAFLVDSIVNGVGNKAIPAGTTIAMIVGGTVAEFAMKILALLLTFFILKLVLMGVGKLLSGVISAIPIVGGVNILLGFVVGLLYAWLILSAAIAILTLIPSAGIINTFNGCTVVKFFYNHNLILKILG
jgi:uncharacterized membrane protein required for colicin V production